MNDASVPDDVQTLERLMAHYGDSFLRMCWRLLHDRELARDTAQKNFPKAYRALNSLREGETEKAWLMRIARYGVRLASRLGRRNPDGDTGFGRGRQRLIH